MSILFNICGENTFDNTNVVPSELDDPCDLDDSFQMFKMDNTAFIDANPTTQNISLTRQNSLLEWLESENLVDSKFQSRCSSPIELHKSEDKLSFQCFTDTEMGSNDTKNKTYFNHSETCFCDSSHCQELYLRQSKHQRILEPSTLLMKLGFSNYHGQIRMPHELQQHIGYNSCKKCYKALVTLITYIQLKCGFVPKTSNRRKFKVPTQTHYQKSSYILTHLGLNNDFFIHKWAPTFQKRFVEACDGVERIQQYMNNFLNNKF